MKAARSKGKAILDGPFLHADDPLGRSGERTAINISHRNREEASSEAGLGFWLAASSLALAITAILARTMHGARCS
jgi:hypothetical protein